MAEFWTTSGLDLLIATERARRRSSLEESLREAIRSGRLTYGTRLPSSRSLAKDLGWARGTVTAAYDRLIAEGYLHARQGSGTTIGYWPDTPAAGTPASPQGNRWRYDLRPGSTPLGSFPVEEWVRHQAAALRAALPAAFGYGDPAGTVELRTAVAAYLGRVRGVRAKPADIVVTGGITQGLALLTRVLDRVRPGRPIAVEDPGFWFHRGVLSGAAAGVVPLPVDRAGADPGGLAGTDVGAALVTPAHQYPMGVTMSPERRRQLVSWARADDALIIEDDYDGELRHDRATVPALQADAPDRVVYAGTASKALSPGLRLGWLVLPETLVEAVADIQRTVLYSLDVTGQLGLARFITHHGYDRQVRAIRATYHRRRQQLAALVTELSAHLPGLRLSGDAAGGQVVLLLPPDGPSEDDVLGLAADERLRLEGLSRSSHVPGSHPPGLLIGYSAPAAHRYTETLGVLARILRAAR